MLPPWPSFTAEEAEAVSRVLLSNRVNYWTGDECRRFEEAFAEFADSRYAIAVMNGSVALVAALKVLGIGEGDEVVVTSRSYVASASSAVFVGAKPVFADIDRDSQNLTVHTIEQAITTRTRAIIAVHLAGWPCEMDALMDLAERHGLYLVEDCAQAHGARFRGTSVGSFGHIGCWSFCQDKIMTTGGEGGMLTTNDEALWSKLWSYKENGRSWEATFRQKHSPGFRWVHESFGTNLRMTEMQAAIGRIQLERIDQWVSIRRRNAEIIDDRTRTIKGLRVTEVPAHLAHARYRHYLFIRPEMLAKGWDRDRIIAEISRREVPCFHGICPEIYLEKAFEGIGYQPLNRLPVARELGETSLAFLVHPTLSDDDIEKTCRAIEEVMAQAMGESAKNG